MCGKSKCECVLYVGSQVGDRITGGDIYGTIQENTLLEHRVMAPPGARGIVSYIAPAGDYSITDKILEVEFGGVKKVRLQGHCLRNAVGGGFKLQSDIHIFTGKAFLVDPGFLEKNAHPPDAIFVVGRLKFEIEDTEYNGLTGITMFCRSTPCCRCGQCGLPGLWLRSFWLTPPFSQGSVSWMAFSHLSLEVFCIRPGGLPNTEQMSVAKENREAGLKCSCSRFALACGHAQAHSWERREGGWSFSWEGILYITNLVGAQQGYHLGRL